MFGVGSDRGALPAFAGGFPRPALRTGRATFTASGSPCVHAIGVAGPVISFAHGVGILVPGSGNALTANRPNPTKREGPPVGSERVVAGWGPGDTTKEGCESGARRLLR